MSSLLARAPRASVESLEDLGDILNDKCIVKEEPLLEPTFEYKGYYRFGKILGKGSFGTVVEAFRKIDDKPIALKFFQKNAIHKWIPEASVLDSKVDFNLISKSDFFSSFDKNRLIPSEVACLLRASKLDGIVKILDYIPQNDEINLTQEYDSSSSEILDSEARDNSLICIVLERDPEEICFFDYLFQMDYLDEDEARIIFKQIVDTSFNLLLNFIFHGDLKSENILINPRTKKIKIIDFGSAQINDINSAHESASRMSKRGSFSKCKSQSVMTKPVRTFRGTHLYKPPEFILNHCFYPRPSTVWTYGIILYDMLCGHFPFDKDSDILTHQDKEIEFKRTDLSESLKDLVKKCLAFYVADRIVIENVLTHSWLNG
ncbi:serine threonine- kinase pim-3-like [Brachionus plicatilis]|uniref:Serine/threonine-protein kinase 1 n=1 Tax=Brachionus plicatilis TaxID=10195 RepID=A0A3M7SL39_BRAPC|nr:serine threonine- kinase pim-3-like [Brachionus plicatilis]